MLRGLPKDWSAALGVMMTLVRVLPPDEYDEMMAMVKEAGTEFSRRPAPASATPAPASAARTVIDTGGASGTPDSGPRS
jgi:hypothetical protein